MILKNNNKLYKRNQINLQNYMDSLKDHKNKINKSNSFKKNKNLLIIANKFKIKIFKILRLRI